MERDSQSSAIPTQTLHHECLLLWYVTPPYVKRPVSSLDCTRCIQEVNPSFDQFVPLTVLGCLKTPIHAHWAPMKKKPDTRCKMLRLNACLLYSSPLCAEGMQWRLILAPCNLDQSADVLGTGLGLSHSRTVDANPLPQKSQTSSPVVTDS